MEEAIIRAARGDSPCYIIPMIICLKENTLHTFGVGRLAIPLIHGFE
jgi:hypothetical protein